MSDMPTPKNATLTKLLEHDRRFDAHDRRFDEHDRRFDDHDRQFEKITKKLDEHDALFERIISKLVEHDDRLDRIERTMVTKDDFRFVTDTLVAAMGILERLDQERLAGHDRTNRLEAHAGLPNGA